MFVVKYQDIGEKVKVATKKNSQQRAIEEAKKIEKPGRWVIVFDESTGKAVYSERD
jgi:hypothetical protein